MLFGVGMPYYARPGDCQSRLVVPETPRATYRVEQVHGLVFMNGQESLLAGSSDLNRRVRKLLDGHGGVLTLVREVAFRREASIIGWRDAEETGWRMGKHVGRTSFITTSDRR